MRDEREELLDRPSHRRTLLCIHAYSSFYCDADIECRRLFARVIHASWLPARALSSFPSHIPYAFFPLLLSSSLSSTLTLSSILLYCQGNLTLYKNGLRSKRLSSGL